MAARCLSMIWLLVVLLGCTVEPEELEVRDGKAFHKGTSRVYTGYVESYFPATAGEKRRLREKGEYNMGLKEGVWTSYAWNGQREESPYKLGRLDGTVSVFDPHGRKLSEDNWWRGVRHGLSVKWDHNGVILVQRYYEKGEVVAMPMPDHRKTAEELRSRWGAE